MEKTILQTNPGAGYRAHQEEIDAAIHRTLHSSWYVLGKEVSSFEAEFAGFVEASHAVSVANGTDAIELALRACGIGPGDSVFTVSHTAVATVAAIERAGALPVLVDIDPASFNIDVAQIAEAVRDAAAAGSPVPRAIVAVHLYGHPADMPAIMDLARRFGLKVIEDCAQAHGARIAGRPVGTWGDLGAFSFYPTKNLGALGDGGAVVTNDAAMAEEVKLLREYGWKERYISHMPGVNSRLDELQPAILRAKLGHLAAENRRRREISETYNRLLAPAGVDLPAVAENVEHVFHQYVIRDRQRDELRTHLKENGIGTLIHYPAPVHLQPAYQGRVPVAGEGLPETERASREVLSLPMHPHLTDEEVVSVCETIGRWCAARR